MVAEKKQVNKQSIKLAPMRDGRGARRWPHYREAGIVARPGHFLSIFQAGMACVTIAPSLDLPQIPPFFQAYTRLPRRKQGAGMEPGTVCGVYLFACFKRVSGSAGCFPNQFLSR